MRRFGLRLGLVLNPAVVAAVLAVMAVVAAGPGAAAFSLFVLAGVLRIADIAATDGTTRTSINAAYQVVPIGERLAVQAVVEGIGVPVAIGATGVLLLALNVLDLGTGAVIVFGLVLGVVWTVIAVARVPLVHARARRRDATRLARSPPPSTSPRTTQRVRALLRSDDARDVRLGLDLLAGAASPAAAVELRQARDHADPEVRVRALVQLAASGDAPRSRERPRSLVTTSPLRRTRPNGARPRSPSAHRGRRRRDACSSCSSTTPTRPCEPAALDAVGPDDAGDPEVVGRVVAALEEPRTVGSATRRVRRLGDAAVPFLARRARSRRRAEASALCARGGHRRRRSTASPSSRRRSHDPDRAVVLAALDALDAAGGGRLVPPDVLDGVFRDAAAHAARALAARASLDAEDGPLHRALDDEIELARRLVIAVLALRHGDRVRAAVRVVDHADGQRRALGVEALDVLLSREEAAIALPLVRRDLTPASRRPARRFRAVRAQRGALDRGHGGRPGRCLALVLARRLRTARGLIAGCAPRVVDTRRQATGHDVSERIAGTAPSPTDRWAQTVRSTRHGAPAATDLAGTSLRTTLPAPITHSSWISHPGLR